MATKGTKFSIQTKDKMSLSHTKNRTKLINKLIEYVNTLTPDDIPTLSAAAIFAGTTSKNLQTLYSRYPEDQKLCGIIDFIKTLQEDKLVKGGLENKYNSRLVTFLLERFHGYNPSPTAQTPNLTQNNIFNITPELLQDALEFAKKKP